MPRDSVLRAEMIVDRFELGRAALTSRCARTTTAELVPAAASYPRWRWDIARGRAIGPVVAEVIYPYRAERLAIESRRVEQGNYTFWRLEIELDEDRIRVATQESPHVDIR